MEIKIDQKLISESINKTASEAIANALGEYSVTSAITKVVTEQVAHGAIAEAIVKAVESVDTEELTNHLAKEIQIATTKAVVNILHEGLLSTVCKMRGIGDYSDNDKREREILKTKLFS